MVNDGKKPLTTHQQRVITGAESGRNVAIVGGAGVGKSFTLFALNDWCEAEVVRTITRLLVEQGQLPSSVVALVLMPYLHQSEEKQQFDARPYVSRTAPTGIAAVNVKGTTLHRRFGLTTIDDETEEDVEAHIQTLVKSADLYRKRTDQILELMNDSTVNEYTLRTLLNRIEVQSDDTAVQLLTTEYLIIDEFSMVQEAMIERAERIAQAVRRNKQPMGGIRVYVSGDPLQLPPFPTAEEKWTCVWDPPMLFETKWWKRINPVVIELKEVHRQSDRDFIQLLQGVRTHEKFAAPHPELVRRLRARSRSMAVMHEVNMASLAVDPDYIQPIYIHGRRAEVSTYNETKMNELPERATAFHMQAIIVRTIWTNDPASPPGKTNRVKVNIACHLTNDRFDSVRDKKDKEFAIPVSNHHLERVRGLIQHRLNDMTVSPVQELKSSAQIIILSNVDVDAGISNGTRGVIRGMVPWRPPTDNSFAQPTQPWETLPTWLRKGKYVSRPVADGFTTLYYRRFTYHHWPKAKMVKTKLHNVPDPVTLNLHPWKIKLPRDDTAPIDPDFVSEHMYLFQIPMSACWALTGDKAQGQTFFEGAFVNMESCFKSGHFYTSVSRVPKESLLHIEDFSEAYCGPRVKTQKMHASRAALEFYRSLNAGKLDVGFTSTVKRQRDDTVWTEAAIASATAAAAPPPVSVAIPTDDELELLDQLDAPNAAASDSVKPNKKRCL